MVKRTTRHNNGSACVFLFAFNDANQLVKQTVTDEDGTVRHVIEYVFDEKGRKRSEIKTFADDGLETIEYDEDGDVTLYLRKDADGNVIEISESKKYGDTDYYN